MWMVAADRLCRKHLLGEHVETHMLLGSLARGKNLRGFFEKGLLEPRSLSARHDELAAEMLVRGYVHRSPLDSLALERALADLSRDDRDRVVDREKAENELRRRCEECRRRFGDDPSVRFR